MFNESEHPRDSDGKFTDGDSEFNSTKDKLDNYQKNYGTLWYKGESNSSSSTGQIEIKDIKNKKNFVDFIDQQLNVRLENEEDDLFNKKRNLLYTKIPKEKRNSILSFLNKHGFETSEHMNGYYWINIKPTS